MSWKMVKLRRIMTFVINDEEWFLKNSADM